MSKDIVNKNACISKRAPYYEYPQGWMIDTRKYDDEVGGYIHIKARWFPNITEARKGFLQAYERAKANALERKGRTISFNDSMPLKSFMSVFSEYRLTKVKGSSFYHLDKFVQERFFSKLGEEPIRNVFNRDFATGFKREVIAQSLTKAYKNKALGYYRQMCDYAFGNGLLKADQYAYCKFATEPIGKEEETPKTQRETFSLTDAEVGKLLAAIDNPVHLILTEFLFATGFRLSEALALTPREIDFGRKTITRENVWQVDENGTERRLHRTKSGFDGTFPAGDSIIASLAAYVSANHIADDECLFPCSTDTHRPIEKQWYRKCLKRYCKKAGIREIHPHIARHTFCSKVASLTGDTNMDKRSLEMLTGHTLAVNQSVYTHADEDAMRRIIAKIDKGA